MIAVDEQILAADFACYLVETGRVKEAESLLAELEFCGIASDAARAASLQARGRAALEAGDFAKAGDCFGKAARLLPGDGAGHALMLSLRAVALSELARADGELPAESESLYRQALSCAALARGDRIQFHSSLAMCLAEMGREVDALDESTRAMQLAEREFGADHPITAAILSNHATLLPDAEAAPLLRRALAILDACHQGMRTSAADVLVNLAAKHCFTSAEEVMGWLDRALDIYRTNLGSNHRITAKLQREIAALLEAAKGSGEITNSHN